MCPFALFLNEIASPFCSIFFLLLTFVFSYVRSYQLALALLYTTNCMSLAALYERVLQGPFSSVITFIYYVHPYVRTCTYAAHSFVIWWALSPSRLASHICNYYSENVFMEKYKHKTILDLCLWPFVCACVCLLFLFFLYLLSVLRFSSSVLVLRECVCNNSWAEWSKFGAENFLSTFSPFFCVCEKSRLASVAGAGCCC